MAAKEKPAGFARPLALLLFLLLALPLLVAPSMIRGLAADAWVSHYASAERLPRPPRASARALVERTATAMRNLAPLPQASAAAIRALDIGRRVEFQEKDLDTARIIYRGIREACATVRDRPLSGAGFAVIEARAAALEESARKGIPR